MSNIWYEPTVVNKMSHKLERFHQITRHLNVLHSTSLDHLCQNHAFTPMAFPNSDRPNRGCLLQGVPKNLFFFKQDFTLE